MADSQPQWRIDIVGGSNAGASLELSPGRYTLGNGHDDDIIFVDDVMGPHAAVLEIAPSGLIVRVGRPGRGSAKAVFKSTGRRKQEFSLGLTKFRVHAVVPQRLSDWLNFKLAVVIGICLVLPLPFLRHSPAAASDIAAVSAGPVERSGADALIESVAFTNAPAPLSGYDALINRLQIEHLDAGLEFSPVQGGIVVTGAMPRDRQGAWMDVKQWFDEHYGTSLVLVDQITEAQKPTGPHLAISAVRSGAVRYVITEHGEKLGEGAVVEGGWTIMEIRSDCVILRHEGRTVEITF